VQYGVEGLADKPGRGHRPLFHPDGVMSPNGKLVG